MNLRNRKSHLVANDYETHRNDVMYEFDPSELCVCVCASLYYNITFRLTSTNTLYISVRNVNLCEPNRKASDWVRGDEEKKKGIATT